MRTINADMIYDMTGASKQSSCNGDHSCTAIKYLTPLIIILNLHFVLTPGKKLSLGMPYLLIEGSHTEPVRLLEVKDDQEYVYLRVRNLKTRKISTLSWLLGATDGYWLWSLASLDYFIKMTEDRNVDNFADPKL